MLLNTRGHWISQCTECKMKQNAISVKMLVNWRCADIIKHMQAHKLEEKERELTQRDTLHKEHVAKLEAKVSDILNPFQFLILLNFKSLCTYTQ